MVVRLDTPRLDSRFVHTLKMAELPVTIDELTEHVPVRVNWYQLGTGLKLEKRDLDAIDRARVADKLSHMFQLWLDQTPNASRRDVLEALRKDNVKEYTIADKYEEWIERQKLNEILKKHEKCLQQTCDDDQLFLALYNAIPCFDIGLAISLELEKSHIEQIKKENPSDEKEKVITMFWKWKELHGSDATYLSLIQALLKNHKMEAVYVMLNQILGGSEVFTSTSQSTTDNSCMTNMTPQRTRDRFSESYSFPEKDSHDDITSGNSNLMIVALFRQESHIPRSETSDPRSPSWELFRRHYDSIVDAIDDDDELCQKLTEQMLNERLISATEAKRALSLSKVQMKVKAVLSTFDTKILRGRGPDQHLDEFVCILSKFVATRPSVEELVESMKRDARESGIQLLKKETHETCTTKGEISVARPLTVSDCEGKLKSYDSHSIGRYSSYLRKQYQNQKPESLWSDEYQKIFDLTIVLKDDIPRDHSFDDGFAKASLSLKDIEEGCPMGSRVLIEGAPGIGKSTLASRFCKGWADKELFSTYYLLVRIRLREHKKLLIELKDLFLHRDEKLQQEVYEFVQEGEGVLFILDSYDELLIQSEEVIGFFNDLIESKSFPDASVIVFTRHSANKKLRKLNVFFKSRFEILGFNEATINEYLSSHNLLQSIDNFHHLRSCFPVPLYLAIIVKCSRSHNLKTITDVYCLLIVFLLQRYLDRQNDTFNLHSIFELPPIIHDKFLELCSFAYSMTFANDQPQLSPKAAMHFNITDESHLSDLAREFIIQDSADYLRSFSFTHFTIQEFLAAFHISKFTSTELQDIYTQYFAKCPEQASYATIFSFVAGLTRLESIVLNFPAKISNFNLFQQLYESQNTALIQQVLVESIHVHRIWPPRITIHDFFVLGYCMGISQCKWQLGFTFRTVTSEHITMLKKGVLEAIGKQCKTSGRVEVISFALNDIEGCGLDELMLIALETNLLDSLETLNLRGAKISSCASLPRHFEKLPSLQKLVIHDNNIQYGSHAEMIDALCKSSTLKSVSFSNLSPRECNILLTKAAVENVQLWQIYEESIHEIVRCLRNSQSVKTLSLHESVLTCDNLTHLSTSLQFNRTLQVLEFVNCNVTCEVCGCIAEAVIESKSIIISLNLENNLIQNEGGRHLVRMLEDDRKSFSLNVYRNPLGEESVDKLVSVVRRYMNNKVTLSLKWREYIFTKFKDGSLITKTFDFK